MTDTAVCDISNTNGSDATAMAEPVTQSQSRKRKVEDFYGLEVPKKFGSLDIIFGCMFSGKSTELLNRINKALVIYEKVLIVNHSIDKRYDEMGGVCSHDKQRIDAVTIPKLGDLLDKQEYRDSSVIFVDEAQFFDDLSDFATQAVERDGKWVTVCGLDGDSDRKPFGQLMDIVPLADTVTKTTALCKTCRNGTKAIFTACLKADKNTQVDVGGADKYVPLCREHYLENLGLLYRKQAGSSQE